VHQGDSARVDRTKEACAMKKFLNARPNEIPFETPPEEPWSPPQPELPQPVTPPPEPLGPVREPDPRPGSPVHEPGPIPPPAKPPPEPA
jgi:hypothetical protein